jgi:8-oxo-dGTP pyrophosphatase MutT (NUDIX family)
MPLKPWKLISSQTSKSLPIFDLRTDRAQSPRTRKDHNFYILESRDWVNVIPLTSDNDVVLVRQYRHGTRTITLEIPGGVIEGNDSPEETAMRELREETGYHGSDIQLLGHMHPNPAFLNNICYTYLARDVTIVGEQEQDEKEDIEVVLKPVEEIPRLIRERQITHSLILAAFYRFFMEFSSSSE